MSVTINRLSRLIVKHIKCLYDIISLTEIVWLIEFWLKITFLIVHMGTISNENSKV